MNWRDSQYLRSEQGQLRRMLEKIPLSDVIDRMSIEERLKEIETALLIAGVVNLEHHPELL